MTTQERVSVFLTVRRPSRFCDDCITESLELSPVENHAYAVALHFMYYNFVRIHQTLRVTPAMAAGVTDCLWELEDIVRLAD